MNEIESAEFLLEHVELVLSDIAIDALENEEPEIFWDDIWAMWDEE